MTYLHITTEEQELLKEAEPFLWINPSYQDATSVSGKPNPEDLQQAGSRLRRFAPLLCQLFPELKQSNGLIESPLLEAKALNGNEDRGRLLLKADHALPVAGSIKARGGIHEVLFFCEKLALEKGLLKSLTDDYRILAGVEAQSLFAKYTLAVGSTGNLGLSIGIMAKALGFQAVVHMSSDAKEWKKERLRRRGVEVVEHQADYGAAVDAGRKAAEADAFGYFVDDECSPHLFMGYGVAALRLKQQLADRNVQVDANHPLFVYLPAGVGGAPGGITYGLKSIFGEHVHCFFAEPVQAPCMLLGMAGGVQSAPVSIYDFGLKIDTDADGLAVGTASKWVCEATRDLVSGVYTAEDQRLYQYLYKLKKEENIEVEPSAAIGCMGMDYLAGETGQAYLLKHGLQDKMAQSTHIAWLTGGSFVPEEEYKAYLSKAESLIES